VSQDALHPVLAPDLLELIVEVFDHEFGDSLDAEVRDQANRELA
jgi:hypothetical protein